MQYFLHIAEVQHLIPASGSASEKRFQRDGAAYKSIHRICIILLQVLFRQEPATSMSTAFANWITLSVSPTRSANKGLRINTINQLLKLFGTKSATIIHYHKQTFWPASIHICQMLILEFKAPFILAHVRLPPAAPAACGWTLIWLASNPPGHS